MSQSKSPGQSGKQTYYYHPDDPKRSFDVYIDKNPKDTIPIKYKTVSDVRDTIRHLEKLYRADAYPHQRIWKVAMIMRVRLGVILKHQATRYPNAKQVKPRYDLANRYFEFLKQRTKLKSTKDRKKLKFRFTTRR